MERTTHGQETVADPVANSVSDRNRNLKPFKKGQSGNPSGRPKKAHDVAALAKDNSVKAMERLVRLIDSVDDKVALSAANAVLDRAVGKPKQTVDMDASVKHDHGSKPVSETAQWVEDLLRERQDRASPESLPN